METTVSFYLVGGTYITFEFSNEPLSRNFDEYENYFGQEAGLSVKHYKFRIAEGTAFDFNTDGEVFATKENSSVYNDNLYVQNLTPAKSFRIYEFQPGTEIIFDSAKVKIFGANEKTLKVDSIAIKQLTKIEATKRNLII